MGLMSHIDLAPKNGDFIILRDLRSGSWEVGRWAQESGSWVQIDGKPLRLFPTHWAPVSDDPAGSTDRERLSFLVTSKWPRARVILAFAATVILISGYAVFDFGFIGTGPVKDSSPDKIIGSATELEQDRERDRADVFVRNLAAAREEIALLIGRENAAQAEALQAKLVAEVKEKELKQALDEKTARAEALARDLAAEIAVTIGRENAEQAEALQAKLVAEAKEKELKQALDEKTARAEALARELASVRENIASAGKPLNVDVVAQDGASPTGSLNRPIQGSNAAPAIKRVFPNKESPNDVTIEPPTGDVVVGLSRPPTRPSQSQPTSATAVTPNNAATDDANALIAQTPSQPKCDVNACTSAYRSFRKSDCTYQPGDGPRRLCPNGVVPSEPSSAPVAAPISNPDADANPQSNALIAQTPSQPKCDVNACTSAYRSFRKSDCTYQTRDGPRRLCTKGVVPSEPSGAPGAAATSHSDADANPQSNARRNVNACAAAYGSFNRSDCTFKPYDPLGGPRRRCEK